MSAWELLVVAGMVVITFVTRGFFIMFDRELPMPQWLRQGLQYAPLAALAAVVTPEILMSHGQLISTWKDARLFGTAAGLAWFFWRRSMLGTIVCGTGVFLAMRLGLGW